MTYIRAKAVSYILVALFANTFELLIILFSLLFLF